MRSASRVFAVPNRRHVFDVVYANPGIGFRELVRIAGLSNGTVRHHLSVLARCGFVVEQRHGRRIALFDARSAGPAWRALVALRSPELQALHAAIVQAPGCTRANLRCAMQRLGWARSTTFHRLQRLEQCGLVQVVRHGRSKIYWSTASRPDATALSFQLGGSNDTFDLAPPLDFPSLHRLRERSSPPPNPSPVPPRELTVLGRQAKYRSVQERRQDQRA